jgi:hypothetical protein
MQVIGEDRSNMVKTTFTIGSKWACLPASPSSLTEIEEFDIPLNLRGGIEPMGGCPEYF